MLDTIARYTAARDTRPDPLKGAIAGAVGGFVGTLRMSRVSDLWNKINDKLDHASSSRLHAVASRRGTEEDTLPPFGDRTQTRAQQETATAAMEAVGYHPTDQERDIGGNVVHQTTGVLIGAAYGIAAEYVPILKRTYGVPLALGAYSLGRQAILPLTGLAPRPTKQPPADHLLSLASYIAYGFFCELVRSRLRQAMKAD